MTAFLSDRGLRRTGHACSPANFIVNKGMLEGKEVSWLPSYGPEMRGGTANCSVPSCPTSPSPPPSSTIRTS